MDIKEIVRQWSLNILIKANRSMKLRTTGYRTLRKTSKIEIILIPMNNVWRAVSTS